MNTIKVKINKYKFDVSDIEQLKEYEKLCETLKNSNYYYDFFNYIGSMKDSDFHKNLPSELTINTELLFSNQYNTVEGFRIFDWNEPIYFNKNIKEGYYLTGNLKELQDAKNNQLICGYCGERYDKNKQQSLFCYKCLGSEYLKESQLNLLILKPVATKFPKRDFKFIEDKTLIQNLKEEYKIKQNEMYSKKADKLKKEFYEELKKEFYEELKKENNKKIYECEVKFTLLKNGLPVDDIIYYDHLDQWVYGWRSNEPKLSFNEFYERVKNIKDIPLDKNGIEFVNIFHNKKGK